MKLKAIMAVLLIGTLGLFGCSSDDDDNSPTPPATKSAPVAKALVDGADVQITNNAGAIVYTGKTVKGMYTFETATLADGGPFTVVATGGTLMTGGEGTPFTGGALSAVVLNNGTPNVNFATTLAAALYDALPAEAKTDPAAALAGVQNQVVQLVAALAAPVLKDIHDTPLDAEALFGAPTAYSESILLTALGAMQAISTSAQVTDMKVAEGNVATLVQGLVENYSSNGVVDMSTVTTTVTANVSNIENSKGAIVDAIAANSVAIVANVPGNTDQAFADAGTAVDTGTVPALPDPEKQLPLSIAALYYDANSSQPTIVEWHVNNATSFTLTTSMFGQLSANSSKVPAESLVFKGAPSGLSVWDGTAKTVTLTYEDAKTWLVNANNNSSVLNAEGTFSAPADNAYAGGTVNYPFKVVFDNAGNSSVKLGDGSYKDVPFN